MNQSDQLDQWALALINIQAEVPAIPKDASNPFFKSKYADLSSVVETAAPIVAKHGMAVSQWPGYSDGRDTLTTLVVHLSGQWVSDTMRLHLVKDDPQGQGSAITYAKRYSYMAALGLVADEDDDGNAASKARKPAQKKPAPPAPAGMIPSGEAKTRLVATCGGDKQAAAAVWGDRGHDPIKEEELVRLIAGYEKQVSENPTEKDGVDSPGGNGSPAANEEAERAGSGDTVSAGKSGREPSTARVSGRRGNSASAASGPDTTDDERPFV